MSVFLLLQRNSRQKQQKELRLCYGLQFEGTVRGGGEVMTAAPGGSCSPCVLSQEAERGVLLTSSLFPVSVVHFPVPYEMAPPTCRVSLPTLVDLI